MAIKDIDRIVQDIKDYDTITNMIASVHRMNNINIEIIPTQEGGKWNCQLDSHPIDSDGTKDSTPSCTSNDDRGLWYCFGEGIGGNIFDYVQNLMHCDFIESIYKVAEAIDFNISPYEAEPSPQDIIRNNLMNANADTMTLLYNNLINTSSVMEYLYKRGITRESIDEYGLGYCPPLKDGNTVLINMQYAYELQLGRRDMFNDSITFPVCNPSGKILYFRTRPFNSITGAKYIGANDAHPLFDPCRMFGFDIARHKIRKNNPLIVVEGEIDCITLNQIGYPCIALLGSTISPELFELFDRYKITEIIMLLDGDKTGIAKTFSNCKKYLSYNTQISLKVAVCPYGADPNELYCSGRIDEIRKVLNNTVHAIQYVIDSYECDTSSPTGKIDYINNAIKHINQIKKKSTKDIMISYIANKVNLDYMQVCDYFIETSNVEIPLWNIDGEEILLGEILRDPDFIYNIEFNVDDWYLHRHKQLFQIMKQVESITIDSISTTARNLGISDINISWLEYLKTKTGDIRFILNDVEDKIIRRNAIDTLDNAKLELLNLTNDSIIGIDKFTTKLYEVAHKKSDKHVYNGKNTVDSTMSLIMQRMNNPSQLIGWSWGKKYPKLNSYTLGIAPKTLNIISANQSVGKSTITMDFALDLAIEQNTPVLWFSLEMSNTAMTFRNFANRSGVMCDKIMTGNLTDDELMKVQKSAIEIRNAPLYISETGHDLLESLSIAKRYVQAKNVKIVVIDYLQLQVVSDKKTDTRSRELGTISKEWKQFAMDNNVAVILISQLGKQALSKEIAGAEDGFGSYEVAQDADIYITLKDKSEEEIAERGLEHGNITLNISKNRNGQKTVLLDIYHEGGLYRMREV